jgi:glycosyltransferase involved in cell wall biosynthesis/2-polyprenyl-3-methyl-5-hydroxy-6-metoxy-1,4-benzoquinol methylase
MKVLQCISSLEGGGAEKQFGYLCESLVELGIEVVAVSLRGGKNVERVLNSGATYIQLNNIGNFDPLIIWRLHRLIGQHQPDLVQTWIPQMDIFGGVAARLANIPHVLSERTSAEGLPRGWREYLRVAIGRHAAAIVANGMGGKEYWLGRAPEIPISVIPNSIPFAEIDRAVPIEESDFALEPGDELVVYLGQLIMLKNLLNLVPALISVVSKREHTKAVLIGAGPLSSSISSFIDVAGLSHKVRVIPYTTKPYGWLKRANAFVSVSKYEGNPNAVLEAVGASCPVVVSDIPAHQEFLDLHSARFVSGQSCESIEAGIHDVLAYPVAAKERASFAREQLSTRTGEAIARQYVALYEQLVPIRAKKTMGVDWPREVGPNRCKLFRCPTCRSELRLADATDCCVELAISPQSSSAMICTRCERIYPVRESIPRFVSDSGYTGSFGFQWNIHTQTQLDSYSGISISRDRLFETTGWPQDMTGETVLEAGSGAGRFTEILVSTGATLYSFDYSEAVEANYRNNGKNPNLTLFQASIYEIPCRISSFDKVICLGVIQHTPDPAESFRHLAAMVRPGGELVIDVYAKDFAAVIQWKYLLRPITKRINKAVLYRVISIVVPFFVPLARLLRRIVGRTGARIVPIVEYSHLGLQSKINREWAILDTFDMYSPAHDHPQSISTIRRWFQDEGFVDIVVCRGHNGVVGRGRKP